MLSVTYARRQMFYYTGKRCNLTQWITDEKVEKKELKRNQIAPNGQTSRDFNADLDEIRVAVNDLFKAYDVAEIIPEIGKLRDDLKMKLGKEVKVDDKEGFFDRFDQFIKDGKQSYNRKKGFTTVKNGLEKYAPETSFENLDVDKFRTYLLGKVSNNTIGTYLNVLKTFTNFALKKKYTNINPFEGVDIDAGKYGKPIYISIEERDSLFDANIEDKSLAVIRDIFVLQCLIGCRYGDLMRLRKSNIIDGCIQYINEKGKNSKVIVIRVPLGEKAKAIIHRYNFSDGRLLPYKCLTEYDFELKNVFRSVGIKRNVTVTDELTGLDKQIPICDIASSHMARRCFIGGLYKKGVKNATIASMSGHVKDSKAFGRYYDIDQEDQETAIKLIQ